MKNIKTYLKKASILLFVPLLALSSCKSVKVPDGVKVVENFDVNKYAGTWYEVARFDFKQERGLSKVTANYSLNEDGSIKVVNRGYNAEKEEWKEAIGKAKFLNDRSIGALKVSFFGPFYAGYNVVMMQPDYKTALIFGENTDYLWFLSRVKTISEDVKKSFMEKAKEAGYDLSRLIWTKQD